MATLRTSGRELKTMIAALLRSENFSNALERILELPARRAVSPLFSLFCDRSALLRWRAVTAMGAVVGALAEREPESARVVMRRFMWNLNEESGGIGWGCPEAMGESMARSALLADEFGCILASYLWPQGNYLEFSAIQPGVLWGLGRLAYARPAVMGDCAGRVNPFLTAADPQRRGVAAWAAGALGDAESIPLLTRLHEDMECLDFYGSGQLTRVAVSQLARAASVRLSSKVAVNV
ncbi:MAG: HEAT repeat domain-containing protein [Desulfobacterales bacterium]|jgi:HEAT repeat protein|nr:HEAT repeat domain-containing protein [Desulfobacterales bacterium]